MNYVSFLSGLDIKDLQTAYSIVQRKKQEKSDSTELHKRQKWEWIQTYIDQVMNGNEHCCVCKKEMCP